MRGSTALLMESTRAAQRVEGAAANETAAPSTPDAPPITLTDAQRKKILARALALPTESVAKLPRYFSAKLLWLAATQAMAWRDREALTAIDDGQKPMTAHEIEDFGRFVEFAREVEAQHGMPAARDGAPVAERTDQEIFSEMLRHRATLCDALKLRALNDPTLRARIVAIRKATRQADVNRELRRLLAMFDSAEMSSWVTKLPKGEGPALASLRALYTEWDRRHRNGKVPAVAIADDDLMRRAWTLAIGPLERVLHLGRYLTRGVEGREGAYGYFRPTRTSRRTKSDASKKPPVADPVSKPNG